MGVFCRENDKNKKSVSVSHDVFFNTPTRCQQRQTFSYHIHSDYSVSRSLFAFRFFLLKKQFIAHKAAVALFNRFKNMYIYISEN